MKKPLVFVVQEMNRFDYSDAERFGDLVFMTATEFRPYRCPSNGRVMTDISSSLSKDFDPDRDYLLMSGNPIVMSYAFHKAIGIKGYVRILHWDNMTKMYNEFVFNPDAMQAS